jgi:hypothetical protein
VITNVQIGALAWQYGTTESFQSFPLNRLFTTVTASVNNVSTSLNQREIMPALLRMIPQEYLQKYNGMTPTMLDNYGSLAAAVGANSNPMGDYTNATHNQYLLPRGCHKIEYGNWLVDRNIFGGGNDTSLVSANVGDIFTIDMDVTFTEPLLISPFMFNSFGANKSGFLGINNFSLVISADAALSRLWSTANPAAISGAANYVISPRPGAIGGTFGTTELLCNFLTAPVSMVLPPKSVLPFNNFTSYVTQTSGNTAARVARTAAGINGAIASTVRSINSIQFEVVPDMLLIFARAVASGSLTQLDSDTFLPLTSCSITFGNKSGLLSSASVQDLWLLSKKNGSCIDWPGFQGIVNKSLSVNPVVNEVSTCGSLLVLNPSLDFGLQSPYISNGSVGQFNFQMQLGVANNTLAALAPEIVVVAMRSGVVVTSSGQSTLTTNMLNASLVTEAIEKHQKPSKPQDFERLVGGGARSGGSRSGGLSSKLSALSM